MDNVRNITGCPMAGLDPDELLDASPITREIQAAIVGHKAFSNLPRKFNLSVSGCRHDCATAQIHDSALRPPSKTGALASTSWSAVWEANRPPSPRTPMCFIEPQEAAQFRLSVVEFFRDRGHREERHRSRLRWLREDLGTAAFRAELEARTGPLGRAGESQIEQYAGDHIGVYASEAVWA